MKKTPTSAILAAFLLTYSLPIRSQTPQATPVKSTPATDSSAQASPITNNPAAPAKADDAAAQASPLAPPPKAETIPANTVLQVGITQALDSGHMQNGESVSGVLKNSIRTSTGRTLPAGTETTLTIVSAVPAGKLESSGEMTLQVVRVGAIHLLSSVITRKGATGPRDLPDSNPAKGTDATLAPGTVLTFQVSPPPIPSK